MAIYHGDDPEHFRQSLSSIKNQSRKADEVVVVLDGPVPEGLRETLFAFSDSLNIVLSELPTNAGLAAALNHGLEICSNEIIFRCDPDDLCRPNRFQTQFEFMIGNPDLVVCGMQAQMVDDAGQALGIRRVPLQFREIASFSKYRSPLTHPTVCFRKTEIISVGGYPKFRKGQDYALWSVLLQEGFKIGNIEEIGIDFRITRNFAARRGLSHLKHEIDVIKFQRAIRFLTPFECVRNIALRIFFRILPVFLINHVYKTLFLYKK